MQKLGAIIALVAGIFGTAGAMVHLLYMRGLGAAWESAIAESELGYDPAGEVAEAVAGHPLTVLIYGAAFLSFATIVLGAIAIGAKGKMPGKLLIVCAVLGFFLGPTLVAICMALAVIGGILATAGAGRR